MTLELIYLTPRLALLSQNASCDQALLYSFLQRHASYVILNCTARLADNPKLQSSTRFTPLRKSNPPSLCQLLQISKLISNYLSEDPYRVVVVQTLNSKSRAKLIICALLLYLNYCRTAEEASKHYNKVRKTAINQQTLIYLQKVLALRCLPVRCFYLRAARFRIPFIGVFQVFCSSPGEEMRLIYVHDKLSQIQEYLSGLSQEKYHKTQPDWSYVSRPVIISGDVLLKFYDCADFQPRFTTQMAFNTALHPLEKGHVIVLTNKQVHPQELVDKTPPGFQVELQLGTFCQHSGQTCQQCRSIYNTDQVGQILSERRQYSKKELVRMLFGAECLERWKEGAAARQEELFLDKESFPGQ